MQHPPPYPTWTWALALFTALLFAAELGWSAWASVRLDKGDEFAAQLETRAQKASGKPALRRHTPAGSVHPR